MFFDDFVDIYLYRQNHCTKFLCEILNIMFWSPIIQLDVYRGGGNNE